MANSCGYLCLLNDGLVAASSGGIKYSAQGTGILEMSSMSLGQHRDYWGDGGVRRVCKVRNRYIQVLVANDAELEPLKSSTEGSRALMFSYMLAMGS